MATTKVNTEFIAVNAISGTIIADNAITATHIATNAISGTLVQNGGIVTTMIAANNITSTKIVTDAVLTRHIADDQVTAAKLANSINTDIAAKLPLAGGTMTGDLVLKSDGGDNVINVVHSGNTAQIVSIGQSSDNSGNGVIQLKRNNGVLHSQIHSHGNTYFNGGNVGIGFTSGTPDRLLHVKGTGNVYGKFETTNATGAGIEVKDTSEDWLIQADGGSVDGLAFYDLGRTAYRMVIDDSGNVGIGTTSPFGTTSNRTAVSVNGTTDVSLNVGTGGSQRAYLYAASSFARVSTIGAIPLQLGTNDTERMRIDSSGDVLIGQTSQTGYTFAQKLVVGDGDANDGITIQSGSTHQGNLAFNHSDGTTAHGRISYQHNSDYMSFFTGNTERMRITSTGLGIGTDAPGVPFVIQVPASAVNAEMRFQSGAYTSDHFKAYANQSGRFYIQAVSNTSHGVYLQYNGTSWTGVSDERLKENIVELENVLPKITNLRAVKYNFIADEENTTAIGFIAQDWQTDFSEVVSDSIPEELGINYTETIPVLLKAIQEQQTIIEDLKSRVETLEG